MPFTIGLTGGIASGKSTVTRRFMAQGIDAVDADEIAREIVQPGTPVLNALVARYGNALLTEQGTLNRAWLRQIIFDSPTEREWVEALMHPAIRVRLRERLAACHSDYVLLVAPLLFETGLDQLSDRTLVVDIPEELQRERLRQRDGCDEAQIDAILKAQLNRTDRLSRADDIFDNTQPFDTVDERVRALDHLYRALAVDSMTRNTS